MADRYGSGPDASNVEDTASHNPTVGSKKEKADGGYDSMKTPSGYKRSGYKRSGTHSPVEE